MASATRQIRAHDIAYAEPGIGLGRRLAHFTATLMAALEVARERRALRRMDARLLKDIGISRADALRETQRGFWDLPEERMPKR